MAQDLVAQALASLRQGDFASARANMQAHAADHQREAQHYLIEGLATLAMSDWSAARDVFGKACADFPDNPQFWFNRGLAEENLNQLGDAEASYQRSLSIKPEQGAIFGNLSNIYRRQRRFPEAVQMACRAVAAGAEKAEALNVLALALGKQGNFGEAQKALDEALLLAPDDPAFLANRANLAVDQLNFAEAWGFFASARAADDSAIIKRDEGMARLLAGDYATGLPLYEARLELPQALRLHPPCPRWRGEPLDGKTLLLVSEQGFGDTIQFSRYAQPLVDAGANLLWTVREPLVRLLAANVAGQVIAEGEVTGDLVPLPLAGGVGGGLGVCPTAQTSPSSIQNPLQNTETNPPDLPPCPPPTPPTSGRGALAADYWMPILSLPLALGMQAATTSAAPLFRAPVEPKLPDANAKRKIGLVWSGSASHERDHERSIPLALLAPLWDKIDAQFYAPFKGAANALKQVRHSREGGNPSPRVCAEQDSYARYRSQMDSRLRGNDVEKGFPILSLDHLITDFADTAALLAQLDCLITVDTAAAHLAGALGVPTYLLLPHCPDWRWGSSGETTRWYAHMTLLRQPRYGDWASVIERLLEKLA
jgi:tetratricopeptide (TPR) repeat protein